MSFQMGELGFVHTVALIRGYLQKKFHTLGGYLFKNETRSSKEYKKLDFIGNLGVVAMS